MKKKTFIVQLLDSKKPSRTSFTQVEDALFYSNDTDASLVFIPHEDTFDFESAKVVMFNLGDESLVERDMVVTTEDGRKVASYELPDEIISHWGEWVAQPVFISGDEIYSGAIVPFSVERHLMHERPPKLTEVVTVTKFVERSQELVNAMIQAEAQRITEEQVRQDSEANRVQAENERSVKYESYAQQFNDVITDLSEEKDYHSLPEISAARGGHETLGARLDDTTAQLAQTATSFDKLNRLNNGVLQYGRITLPSDFPRKLPFNLFRNNDGAISHDFDFDTLEIDATNVYIKHLGGLESNDGLTPETGVQSMTKALSIANALPANSVIINILDDIADYRRFYDVFQHNITKNIVIKSASPSGRTLYHCGQPPNDLVWTPNGDIFQTNRTSCVGVFDNKYRGEFDTVLDYIKVDSIQQCRENKPSYYTNGTDVYVNTLDGRKPDEQLVCQVSRNINMRFDISDGKRLVMRGIDWLLTAKSTSTTTVQDTMRISAGNNINNGTEFWAEDCSFGYCDYDNGLATVAIDSTYLFKCRAYKNGRDGFNYHMRGINADNKPLAFEYDCAGYTNGTNMVNTSSNASTAHDGYNIIRVNSVGYDCYGTLFADVNGCYTIMYDCKAGESTLPFDHVNNYAFGFNDWSAQTDGKAILINCQGGTKNTKAISSDGVPVFVSRFSGDLTGVEIDGLNIL